MITEDNAAVLLDRAAAATTGKIPAFDGRGIVIPAGGIRYFCCAWVCVQMLRELGCRLPVELWHLGQSEVDDEMRRLIEPLGVSCVDAHAVQRVYDARILNGWELKAYAVLHSRFKEVMPFGTAIDAGAAILTEAVLRWRRVRGTIR